MFKDDPEMASNRYQDHVSYAKENPRSLHERSVLPSTSKVSAHMVSPSVHFRTIEQLVVNVATRCAGRKKVVFKQDVVQKRISDRKPMLDAYFNAQTESLKVRGKQVSDELREDFLRRESRRGRGRGRGRG